MVSLRRFLAVITFTVVSLGIQAQMKQTYYPDFKPNESAVYEYTYTQRCTNIDDGEDNFAINAYSLLQVDNINNIFQKAKSGETYTNKFRLTLLEATAYTYTFELDIITPCNITKESTDQDVWMLDVIAQSLEKVKPQITFPRDMSSFMITNKREIIKQVGSDLWVAMLRDKHFPMQMEAEMPTEEEMIDQVTEEFNKGNALFDDIDILSPGFRAFMLFYCQPYVLGDFTLGTPLDGSNSDDIYLHQEAEMGDDGSLNFSSSNDFYRIVNTEAIDVDTTRKAKEGMIFENDKMFTTHTDNVLCTVEINMKSDADTWIRSYRVGSMARFKSAIWTGIEHLKRIK